jgi:hypothetical protein
MITSLKAVVASLLVVMFSDSMPVLGDGGFFFFQETTQLAQTRQKVLLAIHVDPNEAEDRVTYVIGSDYTGEPSEFAWVIPVPAVSTDAVAYDATSASRTNYEQLFIQKLQEHDDAVLVTECAYEHPGVQWIWPEAPDGALGATWLTRMRTVLAPEQMGLDLEFENAPDDAPVQRAFEVSEPEATALAFFAGAPSAALLTYGLFYAALMRRNRWRGGV